MLSRVIRAVCCGFSILPVLFLRRFVVAVALRVIEARLIFDYV